MNIGGRFVGSLEYMYAIEEAQDHLDFVLSCK